MGSQIPVITEKTLVSCGFRKFQLDEMGDHLVLVPLIRVSKHDWVVEQLVYLFLTTHKVNERLKTKAEESTRLTYTGLLGELEHLKIKTRLIDKMFDSVMGEYVFLK